jgi:hypothetical protein
MIAELEELGWSKLDKHFPTLNWLDEFVAADQSSICFGHIDFWARHTGTL